jgi:putative transposase
MVNAKRNIKGEYFHIPNLGLVKAKYHREIPSDFSTCQIKREGDRWFVVLTCKKTITQLPKTNKSIGVDLNSKSYVLSNGIRFDIPKYLKESQFQIKHLQRSLSRKTKGSINRKKAQLKLYKVHQSVANRRLNYFHQLSKTLITEYDHVILEDLNVKDIQQKMGHVVKDNGFSMFRSFIEYKSELYGKECTVIDRWFPSSQICSQCGTVHKISDLGIREYVCPECGLVIDRDLNAAINISRAGTAPDQTNAFGAESGYEEQYVLLGILADCNEEGSHVL